MDRRNFLKSGAAFAAVTLESKRATGGVPNPAADDKFVGLPAPGTGRLVLPMNRNWRFSPQRHTPNDTFSFDLTPHVDWDRENVLAVELDSTERADIPPFGGEIDYLTFGGIYREASLRIVPAAYLENIFARAEEVLGDHPRVRVTCFFAHLDAMLVADGADATRVVLKVADEFGNLLRYATAAISFEIEGPAEIIGDNPFSLMGGCGAIWLRAGQKAGTARLVAKHTELGTRAVEIKVVASELERV